MGQDSTNDVEVRIRTFLEKKAVQYPKIGLAVMNPKMIESTLRPFHEVLADQILEKNSKGMFDYVLSLLKSSPASTYGRTN